MSPRKTCTFLLSTSRGDNRRKSFHSNKSIHGENVQLLYLHDIETEDEVVNIDIRVLFRREKESTRVLFTSRMNIYDEIGKDDRGDHAKTSPKTETVDC